MEARPRLSTKSTDRYFGGAGSGITRIATKTIIDTASNMPPTIHRLRMIAWILHPQAPPNDPSVTIALTNLISELSNRMIQQYPAIERTAPPIKVPIVHFQRV